jgi:uracil-DNA glycosylase
VTDRSLARLEEEVTRCRRCPRLVAWREQVAREARVLVLGLAPAAHGGNRTGRVFTGDRSGDWLFAALHRAGLANQPTSVHRDDGLELRHAWVTAAVRCAPPANKPTPEERDECLPWTVAELAHLTDLRVVVCLGAFAWDAALRLRAALGHPRPRPRPRFGHDAVFDDGRWLALVGCFHPSQQNTFTGKLTEPMLDAVFGRARELAGVG